MTGNSENIQKILAECERLTDELWWIHQKAKRITKKLKQLQEEYSTEAAADDAHGGNC